LSFQECPALVLQFREHCVGNLGFKAHTTDCPVNLVRDDLLSHVFLGARGDPFGASQVVVPLLRLRRDDAAAFTAAKEPAIEVWFQLRRFGLTLLLHDRLCLVKEALGDDGFVFTLENLPI
jgi:hypothetical protein